MLATLLEAEISTIDPDQLSDYGRRASQIFNVCREDAIQRPTAESVCLFEQLISDTRVRYNQRIRLQEDQENSSEWKDCSSDSEGYESALEDLTQE